MTITSKLVSNISTEISEQPTKDWKVNIADWAGWLKFQTHNEPELLQMVYECGEFGCSARYGGKPHWLALLGVTGTGKTHCARLMWNGLKKRYNWSDFTFIPMPIYWPEFVSELRSGTAFDKAAELRQWPLLFLDDIGAERDTTGFAAEQLNTLLGCRVGKWTILTSNLSLEQLGAIDNRIADRIIRRPNQFIEITTKSHSLRQLKP